jgi:protein gp37
MQKFLNERYGSAKAPPHMWFGVSVENWQACSRIAHLRWANAGVRFLSVEPLIEALGRVDLKGIHIVMVAPLVVGITLVVTSTFPGSPVCLLRD